jgi:hypothetical protein
VRVVRLRTSSGTFRPALSVSRYVAAPAPDHRRRITGPFRVARSETAGRLWARMTAPPTSRTPNPVLAFQLPPFEADCFRICATSVARRSGFAASTSAAAPATSGAAKDVPDPNP